MEAILDAGADPNVHSSKRQTIIERHLNINGRDNAEPRVILLYMRYGFNPCLLSFLDYKAIEQLV